MLRSTRLVMLAAVSIAAGFVGSACVDDSTTPGGPQLDGGGLDAANNGPDGSKADATTFDAPSADTSTSDGSLADASTSDAPVDASNDASLDAGTAGPYLYFASNTGNAITGYTLAPATGALTPFAQPFATATPQPLAIAAHPNGKFLFAAHNSGLISAYAVATTGALTHLDSDPGDAGVQDFSVGASMSFASIAADPKGRVLYVVEQNQNRLITLSVSGTTGALAVVSNIVTAAKIPRGLAVDPQAGFLYIVSSFVPPTMVRVPLDPSTGIPTAGPLADGGFPNVVLGTSGTCISGALDPQGRLYTSCSQDQSLYGIGFDGDAGLTSVGSAAAGVSPIGVTVHPNGKFAYSASFSGQTLRTFALAADGGAPSVLGSPLAISASCRTLAFDPTGAFMFAGCDGATIPFAVDAVSGAPTKGTSVTGASDSSYSLAIVAPPL